MYTENEVMDIAPCGTNCGACPAYLCKDNPELLEAVVAKGLKREDLPCPGCREHKGKCAFTDGDCATYDCIVRHGVTFCYECDEFPCQFLHPCADRANILPHNMKLYNLCYIRTYGVDAFRKKFPEIKVRYYGGEMLIGKGPQLP
jgi:hypothetical protein